MPSRGTGDETGVDKGEHNDVGRKAVLARVVRSIVELVEAEVQAVLHENHVC